MGWVARSIAQGHGFSSPFWPSTGPTALVPPLFPYFVAAIFRIFGVYTSSAAIAVLSISSLFSALTCIPLYFSTRYALDDKVALLAAWSWVVYPFAVYFSAARVWDYALTGLLFTTCFCLAQRLHRQRRAFGWLGFGLLYGIAALSNPSVLSMFPVFLILTALNVHRRGEKWLAHSLVATFGVLAVLTPWTIRNYRTLHIITPIRDNFWLESWAGNDGSTFESNDHWAHPASNPTEMERFQTLGEVRYLAEKHVLAVAFIQQHPRIFLKNSLRRGLCFWTAYWSFSPAYLRDQPTEIPDMLFSIPLAIFMLIGARRLWREDKTSALPYIILLTLFPFTYFFTHASPDYRQPIEPEIIALVSAGVLSVISAKNPVKPVMHSDEPVFIA